MSVLDTLEQICSRHGYLPMEDLKSFSAKTGLPLPEIISIASFYSFFAFEPGSETDHIENIYPLRAAGTLTRGGQYEWTALEKARSGPGAVIGAIEAAGLTGRSGGGFPTAMKWEITAREKADVKYVVCNADEGEPGTGKDRFILENNPRAVIEGMAICAAAVGAGEGYIYLRGEYADLREGIEQTIAAAPLGSFKLQLCMGHGAYVCGEETALLDSIEGKRGEVRVKPPYPGAEGLWGRPTVVNNVETFACVPYIINGVKVNTRVYTVFGCVKNPGVYELGSGVTIAQLLEKAGGSETGVSAVLTGGGAGTLLPYEKVKDMPFIPDGCKAYGASYGTASVRFVSKSESLTELVGELMAFFSEESCGMCAPCRTGMPRLLDILSKMERYGTYPEDVALLRDTALHIRQNARCGFGQAAVTPVLTLVENFPEVFSCC